MRFFIAIFTFLCAAWLMASAHAETRRVETDIPARLDKALVDGGVDAVNAEIANIGVDTEMEQQAVLVWARDRYGKRHDRNARIGLLYADTLASKIRGFSRAQEKVDANQTVKRGAEMFLSSQLIAFEDIARCGDKTAGRDYVTLWLTAKSRLLYKNFLASQPAWVRTQVWDNAKSLADERDVSRPDKRLCAGGADVLAKAQLDPACKKEECDPVKFVELVDDTAWKARRDQIQAAVRKRVEEGKI